MFWMFTKKHVECRISSQKNDGKTSKWTDSRLSPETYQMSQKVEHIKPKLEQLPGI